MNSSIFYTSIYHVRLLTAICNFSSTRPMPSISTICPCNLSYGKKNEIKFERKKRQMKKKKKRKISSRKL